MCVPAFSYKVSYSIGMIGNLVKMRVLFAWFVLMQLMVTGTQQIDENLLLAYVNGEGDLYVWQDGDSRMIADGDVSQVVISLAGDVAFVQGDSLWLMMQGEDPRQMLTPVNIAQMIWSGGRLYFNVYEDDLFAPSTDLYELDPANDRMRTVTDGGWINNGVRILPGDYEAETSGAVIWDDARLSFPSVATGSHFAFYPDVQWVDEETIRVAIPAPDALYNEVDYPPVALWEMTETDVTQIGEVAARYFGLPRWSETHLAYLRLENTLFMAQADGTDPRRIASGVWDYFWIEDTLVYLGSDGLYTTEPESAPRLWLPVIPIQMQAVDGGLLYTLMDGLYYAPLGGEPQKLVNDSVIVWYGLILLPA